MKYIITVLFFVPIVAMATTFNVGPGRTYQVPSAVMNLVSDGDTVYIDAGEYLGNVGVWNQDNLTIIGLGGRAHLRADGNAAQGKAIWVIKGDTTALYNIEFSECQVPDNNGAGIRHEGKVLNLQNCSFHHNEMGILTLSNNPGDHILIEYSEFYENGFGDGFSHSVYVNHSSSLTIRYCHFTKAFIGHHIKSRAAKHTIEYNNINDLSDGQSSRLIDLPNGGNTLIKGNILIQGPAAENGNLIGYGLEGINEPTDYFFCVNNTIVSYRHAATFFAMNGDVDTTLVANCVIGGPGNMVQGELYIENILCMQDPDSIQFSDPLNNIYFLTSTSPAIDQGVNYGSINGVDLMVNREYQYELSDVDRIASGSIDLGAHEFQFSSIQSNIRKDERPFFYPTLADREIHFIDPVDDLTIVNISSGKVMQLEHVGDRLDISKLMPGIYNLSSKGRSARLVKQ